MPKYEVSGTFKIEVVAETPEHALDLVYPMSLSKISTEGEVETYEPDYIPPDRDGELADHLSGARSL